jgi:hypothetical protein
VKLKEFNLTKYEHMSKNGMVDDTVMLVGLQCVAEANASGGQTTTAGNY